LRITARPPTAYDCPHRRGPNHGARRPWRAVAAYSASLPANGARAKLHKSVARALPGTRAAHRPHAVFMPTAPGAGPVCPRSPHDRRRVGLEDKTADYSLQLSVGQQQRVAIARALAMRPRLLLFDEITSALDPELIGEVIKVLEQVARDGMTMILVTREMRFAHRGADTVIFMHQGKIWEQGPPAQLFGSPTTAELASFIDAILPLNDAAS
jgi:hypothetical protein